MIIKKLCVIIILFVLGGFLIGQVNFKWAKQIGSSTGDESVRKIAIDNNSNVYTTGLISDYDIVDFDPGPGTFTLTSFGSSDIFVCKFNHYGDFVWAKQIGGVSGQFVYDMTLDKNNNVYICGSFIGTCDFDPGPSVFNLTPSNVAPPGNPDGFICKLDSNGNFLWAKQIGNIGNSCNAISISVDTNAFVYATGYFNGTIDFDPGPGSYTLTSISYPSPDIFILKLDEFGDFLWAKTMGGVGADYVSSIVLDLNCNIYTTGQFHNTADFDPGSGVYNLVSVGGGDVFVCKLNINGDFIWAAKIGGADQQQSTDIAVDKNGNAYITGTTEGNCDFDPGTSVYTITALSIDAFVLKLDTYGNFAWAKQSYGSNNERALSITIDSEKNVYTGGSFWGTVDFDPGPSTYYQTSSGYSDCFIWKLDSLGNFKWARQMGNSLNLDEVQDIIIDKYENLFTTGVFEDQVDFNPGSGTYYLNSSLNKDIYVQKLCQLEIPSISPSGSLAFCQGGSVTLTSSQASSYSWNTGAITQSINVTNAGSFSLNITNTVGCSAQSSAVQVTVFPLPQVLVYSNKSIICINETATITATGAANYNWNFGPTTSSIIVSPTVTTTYMVTGVSIYGCSTSTYITQYVDPCIGVEEYGANKNNFKIYPNPGKGKFNIQLDSSFKNGLMILTNTIGQVVYSQKLNQSTKELILQELMSGLYTITLFEDNQATITVKLIIE